LKEGVFQTRLTKHVDGLFSGTEAAFLHAIHAHVEDAPPESPAALPNKARFSAPLPRPSSHVVVGTRWIPWWKIRAPKAPRLCPSFQGRRKGRAPGGRRVGGGRPPKAASRAWFERTAPAD
jgi:hypothetical protein